MVIRTFTAFDSATLIVESSPRGSLVGNSINNNGSTPNGTVFTYSRGGASEISLNDTGGNRNRFEDSQPNNHVITDGKDLIPNGTRVESESVIRVRALDDSGSPTGPTIELYVFSRDGNSGNIWGYASNTELEDGTSYIKTSGSNIGTSRYNQFITCFAEGTRIATPQGAVAVEDITVGQDLWTLGSGPQPVRWVAKTTVAGQGAFAPVTFDAGVLGNDQPLTVSQQHRMWVKNAMAELLFGKQDVLIAAKHLVGLPGVRIEPCDSVTYAHFMFDSHQIVRANGALSESFFYAEHSVSALEQAQRAELEVLFPSLTTGVARFGAAATMTLTAREAAALRPYLAA